MLPGESNLHKNRNPSEVWIDLQYTYKDNNYSYNIPLSTGEKFLEGIKIEFTRFEIENGRRSTVSVEPFGILRLDGFEVTGHLNYGKDIKTVFVNGFQSATESRDLSPGEKIRSAKWPLNKLLPGFSGDYSFYDYSEKKGNLTVIPMLS